MTLSSRSQDLTEDGRVASAAVIDARLWALRWRTGLRLVEGAELRQTEPRKASPTKQAWWGPS